MLPATPPGPPVAGAPGPVAAGGGRGPAPAPLTVNNQTLRQIVHTSLGAALFAGGYGAVLFAKILVVGAALLAVVLRRHRVELAIATAAIALGALLAALPPSL